MAAKKKHYTWKGLDKCYEKQQAADAALPANLNGKVWSVGFEYEEEAEAFRKGELDNYIRKNHKPIDATQYDAVIYADGSFDNDKVAAYGLIIFFKGETDPYIESGKLWDENIEQYKIAKHDGSGKKTEEVRKNNGLLDSSKKKKGFASESRQVPGELFGVMRAVEECREKKWPKKLLIIYDCNDIETAYRSWEHISDNDSVTTVVYKKCWQKFNDIRPEFSKADSHSGKNSNDDKQQYRIERDDYLHAVYNDLVDILARAELGISINPRDNFNAFRVISDEFERFYTVGADSEEKRIKHARKLINDVLNKSGGIYRPIFSKE